MKKILLFIIAFLYIILFLLTLIGFVAPYLHVSFLPVIQYISPFQVLCFPIHLFCLFLFFKNKHKLRFLTLLGLGLNAYMSSKDFQLSRHTTAPDSAITIMSYNVQNFRFDKKYIDSVILITQSVNPKVLCVQEFRMGLMGISEQALAGEATRNYMAEKLEMPYHAFTGLGTHIVGTAIFSKFPIEQIDTCFMSPVQTNSGSLATLLTPEGKIGIVNLHLPSYRLSAINKKHTWQEKWAAFAHKADSVLAQQNEKVTLTQKVIAKYEYPLIVVGDMNTPAYSYIFRQLSKGLHNTFEEKGVGFAWTYPLWRGFGLHIDHQLHNDMVKALDFQIIPVPFSDHYATMGIYDIRLSGISPLRH